MLPACDQGLCRVSIHRGPAVGDLALPADIPVAMLIPSIIDILKVGDADGDLEARRYQLSPPGGPALDPSMTLWQNGIGDGAVLMLAQAPAPLPAIHYDDVAEAVSAALGAASQPRSDPGQRQVNRLTGTVAAGCLTGIGALALIRNAFNANPVGGIGATASVAAFAGIIALMSAVTAGRAYRDTMAGLTLSVIATAFAAVAGLLAVPGIPGVCHVLLAATAAAATSVLAVRASGCGVVTLTAVSCVATVVALATLVGVFTGSSVSTLASVSALISLGLLGMAPRVSIVLAGLSPRLPRAPEAGDLEASGASVTANAIRADNWWAGLLAGLSCSAAIGAVATVLAGSSRPSCVAFGALTAAQLLLRSPCSDSRRTLVVLITGITVLGTTFGVTAVHAPRLGAWVAAVTAILAAAAMYFGFVAPARSPSPVVRRSVELLECLGLVALVPLTCWICGVYGAARGLNLT